MNRRASRFQELDDLVLRLKGLVLVRDLRRSRNADDDELELYAAEIERVRDRLADLIRCSANGREAQTATPGSTMPVTGR